MCVERQEDDDYPICPDCSGNGSLPPDWRPPCRNCGGTGVLRPEREPDDIDDSWRSVDIDTSDRGG